MKRLRVLPETPKRATLHSQLGPLDSQLRSRLLAGKMARMVEREHHSHGAYTKGRNVSNVPRRRLYDDFCLWACGFKCYTCVFQEPFFSH